MLCGELLNEIHWTERPFDAGMVGGGGAELARRRDRFRRARIVRHVLRHYGLAFDDDWSSTTYRVSNRKGVDVLVKHLGELWPAAEGMAGRALDPLDDRLLEHVSAGGSRGLP